MKQRWGYLAWAGLLSAGLVWAGQMAWANDAQTAVIATVASDYTSGAHAVATVDPVGGPRTIQTNLLPTISDITVVAYGDHFYRLERYDADNVTKFHVDAPDTPVWQRSVKDEADGDTSPNPYDILFVSEEKAYVIRYGSPKIWIINPSVETCGCAFKTGEIDLSAYADADGSPEACGGVIVDRKKLFVVMQRQEFYQLSTDRPAYVAVIDVATDTEIDTSNGTASLPGIPLTVQNPLSIIYLAATDKVYVQGIGNAYGNPKAYTGGIESISPNGYATAMVLDDGDDVTHPYGSIGGMALISDQKGYFVGYDGWQDNTLYRFNPSTGAVMGAVEGFSHIAISGMEGGVYPDQNKMLWVCNQTDARIDILNTETDTIDESLSTDLNPAKVVFVGGGAGEGAGSGNDSCFISTLF
ncbi:MAG: hypothetical protein CSA22_00730 [Deltaproteobacteria bacterium]|nr:MAG: hypothetical protein CSA22_00730 [Deltaproteobacteria bacterium]